MASKQELQIQQKREVEKREEATVPSRVFLPTTDIYEIQDALNVVMETIKHLEHAIDEGNKGHADQATTAEAALNHLQQVN